MRSDFPGMVQSLGSGASSGYRTREEELMGTELAVTRMIVLTIYLRPDCPFRDYLPLKRYRNIH